MQSELFGHEKGSFTGAQARKRGFFEQAHGGTLFLDEIGDMDLGAQAKVLRALQSGETSRVGSEHLIHADVRPMSDAFVASFCSENGLRTRTPTRSRTTSPTGTSPLPTRIVRQPTHLARSRPGMPRFTLLDFREQAGRKYIVETLRAFDWNISRTTLHKKPLGYRISRRE